MKVVRFKYVVPVLLLSISTSCKKEHLCQCGSPLIEIEGLYINDTKKNAEKKCDEREVYFQTTYADVTCGLK